MAKYKVAAKSGALVDQKAEECPITNSTEFIDKFKGRAIIFDTKAVVAEKLDKKHEGQFAMQY